MIAAFIILLILAIPLFFTWRWLLKKVIKNDLTRKVMTWGATIITAPLIYVGIIVVLIFSISYYPEHAFDKEKWLADRDVRYELSRDIIESKMLMGKTKGEVRQLLGDEDNSDKSDHWTYYLGFRPALFNIDPDVLDVEFRDGKVVKVGQHET